LVSIHFVDFYGLVLELTDVKKGGEERADFQTRKLKFLRVIFFEKSSKAVLL
jgi:hypothetical protein